MLIVNVINTLPNIEDRRKKFRCPRRVKCRSKRTEEEKINKTCVSSKNSRMKNEEGATVAATPYLLLSWLTRLSFVGSKAVSTEEVQTIGKYSLNTFYLRLSCRRVGDF